MVAGITLNEVLVHNIPMFITENSLLEFITFKQLKDDIDKERSLE